MRFKHFRKLVIALMMVTLLAGLTTACQKDEPDDVAPAPQPTVIPGYEDGYDPNNDPADTSTDVPAVDFGLQDGGDPTFSDMGTGVDEGLYTIEGGYAYALDPTTFDKVGPPLDPTTHQPIDGADTSGTEGEGSDEGSGDGDASGESAEGEGDGEGADTQGIDDSKKLPNTGIFLEDD